MSRQSLSGVLFMVLIVSTWTILKVDALAKAKLDDVCQELYQNLDKNPQDVDLNILKVCLKRWGERLLRTPNDYTIRLQHNRMQTFLDANGPSHPRVPPARPPSPGGSKPGQVALKQPNVMATAHQPQEGQSKAKRVKVEPPIVVADLHQPGSPQVAQHDVVAAAQQSQSSAVTLHEVYSELVKMQDPLSNKGNRYRTLSTDCKTLADALLGSPNPPIPTEIRLGDYIKIVQDCVKVWEKLRDKAANNQQKQTALENELRLMTQRLKQVLEVKDARAAQQRAEIRAREAARIDACHQLARYPQNLETATMGQMQKYKTDLEDCILRFDKLLARKEETKETKKWILMVEQGTMKAELTRVEDLIKGQSQDQGQNVAAGPSQGKKRPSGSQVTQLQAKLPKVAPQSALNPLNLLQPKLKNAKVKEFKEMIDRATDARPASTAQIKQPNVVAEVHEPESPHGNQHEVVAARRRAQSSVASIDEVLLELSKLRTDTKSKRPYTESFQCTDQVAALLDTPNQPTPTGHDLVKLNYILQDCAKVWEMLRVKAKNDKVKQDRLANELRLLTERITQVQKVTRAREHLRQVMGPVVIATCDDLLLHPWNLHDSTMELKLQYKDQLNECITKWKQRIPNQQSNKRQKKIFLSELVKLEAELTRVKHLIGQDQQNVAAGSGGLGGQPMAKLSKMAASSALNPHHLLQPKLKNLPSAALGKEPGPSGGGSNRNFDIPWRHR